jgi:uncharacterized protein (TIGR02246 family)
MKYALTAVFSIVFSASAQARTMQCAPINDAEVKSQFDRFNGALASKNPDTVTALFGREAVLLPTLSAEERTTPAAIRDYFVHFLQKSPVGHIDTSTIRIGCNMAARVGNWTFTLTDSPTHKKSVAHARYTFIYSYQHGRWMIAHLHSSLMPIGH